MPEIQNSAEPVAGPVAARWPLLRLGFRPFYLGAAAYAVVAMGLWFVVFTGRMAVAPRLSPVLWHAHEMLYGFVIAVIVGFLLTAGQVWTQLSTPRGPALGALFALWAAARVAAVCGPYALFFLLDGSFLIIVAAVFIGLLVRSGNRRNAAIGGVLALHGCGYCLDMHSKDARASRETEQRLYVLPAWRDSRSSVNVSEPHWLGPRH